MGSACSKQLPAAQPKSDASLLGSGVIQRQIDFDMMGGAQCQFDAPRAADTVVGSDNARQSGARLH